jgi:hypothetical protein
MASFSVSPASGSTVNGSSGVKLVITASEAMSWWSLSNNSAPSGATNTWSNSSWESSGSVSSDKKKWTITVPKAS